MANRLKIRLCPGWSGIANLDGPATYFSASGSALQFSSAEYLKGRLPNVTEETLKSLCEKLTLRVRGRSVISTRSGNCDFGIYGTVVVRGEAPAHLQVWVLSDREQFILITHTCETEPNSREMDEANRIALMTRYGGIDQALKSN